MAKEHSKILCFESTFINCCKRCILLKNLSENIKVEIKDSNFIPAKYFQIKWWYKKQIEVFVSKEKYSPYPQRNNISHRKITFL